MKAEYTGDGDSEAFLRGLEAGDMGAIRRAPKSDLHNHGILGMRFASFRRVTGSDAPEPPERFDGLNGFLDWTSTVLRPFGRNKAFTRPLLEAAIEDAIEDGVRVAEMSFDFRAGVAYDDAEGYARLAADLKAEYSGRIDLKPEIGVKKAEDLRRNGAYIEGLIESGCFSSIDIYGKEVPLLFLGKWKRVFRKAAEKGMKLKAHLGEIEPPLGIPLAAESLGVFAIQHGVSVARSERAVSWARNRGVALNICPASNIALGAAVDWKTHPIRKLYDAGLKITIATDDLVAFGMSVSEQYMRLYQEEAFNARELDRIRIMGLEEGRRGGP